MSDDHIIEAMARAMEPVAWGKLLDTFPPALKLRGESLLKATAALAAYRKAAWRPISEAPRDGCSVLVYCGPYHDPMWGVGSFYDDGWHMWWEGNNHPPHEWPTHFQPLPPPPEET